jgi:hypothetical protein
VRRHPWRKSHFLQVGQALRRARGSHPWLLLIKFITLPKTLGFLPLDCVIPAIASITSEFTHSNKQAKNRLIVTELITPNPLKKGGF